MLDSKINLFNLQIERKQVSANKSLVISGCVANLSTEDKIYSEFDELNSYSLNSNDFGFGRMDIEFCFENNFNDPYFQFFAQCFSIRTDNGIKIKINRNELKMLLKEKNYSKLNKENQIVVGIGYYFKTKEERNKILKCELFIIEGFVALGKKKNVYGIMCRMSKTNNQWNFDEGNTYRIYKNININNLWH